MPDVNLCELCGEPMPPGEDVFRYHGYSGPCPTASAKADGDSQPPEGRRP